MGRLTSLPSAVVTDDSALGGAVIEKSLRFNSTDSTYLTKTNSSDGNRTTFTWSGWVKRGNTNPSSTYVALFTGQNAPGASSNDGLFLYEDKIHISWDYDDTGQNIRSTQVVRDTNSWYHIVWAVDTTLASAGDRMKVYINGAQVTLDSNPGQNENSGVNKATDQNIGTWRNGATLNYKFDGYMAEVNFVDGFQLTPSSFGYTEFQTGIWRPKGYFGSYGANGFRLDFSDSSATTAVTLGKDRSGQGNDFTPNNFIVDAEIVTNGEFNSGDSNWTKDSSWSIANGKASNSGGGEIYQTIPVVSGVTYVMTGTVDITADSNVGNTTSLPKLYIINVSKGCSI